MEPDIFALRACNWHHLFTHFVIYDMLKVIAATVASDPEKYCEAFLGKPNAEYCNWILDSEKWGG